jgi:hypothetical protein
MLERIDFGFDFAGYGSAECLGSAINSHSATPKNSKLNVGSTHVAAISLAVTCPTFRLICP